MKEAVDRPAANAPGAAGARPAAGQRPAAGARHLMWPLAVLAGCAALSLVGCSHRLEAFRFAAADGKSIDLWQQAGTGASDRTLFKPASDRTTPLYRLGSAVVVLQGQAFALTYQGSLSGCEISLYSDRKTVLRTAMLPPTSGNAVRFLVDLEPGARIWGFQVGLPDSGTGDVSLEGAGIAPFVHGFSIDGSLLSVDGSIEVRSASQEGIDARLPGTTRREMGAGTWLISIGLSKPQAGGTVTFTGSSAKEEFALDPSSAPPEIAFSSASIGFLPMAIGVRAGVTRVQISQVNDGAPIPSDPGLVLTAYPALWRHPDYELYAWTRYPRVLILDTRSYDVQDDFFNRLAFFVEKAGWVGQIKDPSAYRGVHGYNAHDYKADDLARFFTAAKTNGIPLTPHETTLLSILLAYGVVTAGADGYSPGDGSVLSISRSSGPLLRELLLTHESFHGIYFSLPAFRDATAAVWNALLPSEREFWKRFLASQNYDIGDNYLVVNEFQAYLLQQERSGLPGRQALFLSRLRATPQGARLAAEVAAEAPDSFLRAFDALTAALRGEGGPPGGLVIGVQPVVLR